MGSRLSTAGLFSAMQVLCRGGHVVKDDMGFFCCCKAVFLAHVRRMRVEGGCPRCTDGGMIINKC